MPPVGKGEEAYTKQVHTGAAVKKVENKKKTNLQNNMDYHTATREDGYKLDIDIVINRPGDVKKDYDVLHEKYINKKDYSTKVDGLSDAIQGELLCYVDEEERLKKVVERSNSEAFQKGTGAQVTLADVERAYHDQDDINIDIMQTQNDMEDDLSIFSKYNRNLKSLKFLTKLQMLTDYAEQINKENHKVWGPKTVDASNEDWTRSQNFSKAVDDRYRDEIEIKVSYEEDKESGQSKKKVTKTTTRYVQINIAKYNNQMDSSLVGKWFSQPILENYEIKVFEKMFEGNDYNFRDRIEYLKDPNVID